MAITMAAVTLCGKPNKAAKYENINVLMDKENPYCEARSVHRGVFTLPRFVILYRAE